MACLAPDVTMISSGEISSPWARPSHPAAAARRRGMPSTGVYLVAPASSARLAASLMCAGVSKSGSPAERLMTSAPRARSSAASAVTFMVIDGAITDSRFANRTANLRPLSKPIL